MKEKIFLIIILLFFVITFFIIEEKQEKKNVLVFEEKRAVFISYLEFEEYVKYNDINTSKNNLSAIIKKISDLNFNMIILHVRPFSDSIYKSNIYPYSYTISGTEGEDIGYDVLSYIINECKRYKIEVHAWINPYRIRNNTNTQSLSKNNPAYKYLNTDSVQIIENKGIFYNPSSPIVKQLILDGIEELINSYDIDGIHFDDYFYPSKDIDLKNYEDYINNGGQLSIDDYRYNIISDLIKDVYSLIKEIDPNIKFGISPEGNIENNYDNHYLDIKMMLKNDGYLDYIMPQIYFGFNNETKPFVDTITMWNNLIKKDIDLIPALAFYKSGKMDEYARSGSEEWINNTDIIKRQIVFSRNLSHYKGFSLFRYSSLLKNKDELSNLKSILDRQN